MPNFEITASGFNAFSDETDDRVFWICAESIHQVNAIMDGLDASFGQELPDVDPEDLDYILPGDKLALREKLRNIFLNERIPCFDFEYGHFQVGRDVPIAIVKIAGYSQLDAKAIADKLLPHHSGSVRCTATQLNPRYVDQQKQKNIVYAKNAAIHDALVKECRARPMHRLRIDLEFQKGSDVNDVSLDFFRDTWDGEFVRNDGALVSWIHGCLNSNRNRLIAHLSQVVRGQRDGEGRVSMEIDLGLMPGPGATNLSEIPTASATPEWVSACLNVNPNRVVAKVASLQMDPCESVGDAVQPSDHTTIPRDRGG